MRAPRDSDSCNFMVPLIQMRGVEKANKMASTFFSSLPGTSLMRCVAMYLYLAVSCHQSDLISLSSECHRGAHILFHHDFYVLVYEYKEH